MIVLIDLYSVSASRSKRKFSTDYLNVTVNKWQVPIYQTSHVVLTGNGAPGYITQN